MTIEEILQELDIKFYRHGESSLVTANFVGVECPFCGVGTGKAGLGFATNGRSCTCWKCGPHRVIDALAALTNRPLGAIWYSLQGIYSCPKEPEEKIVGTYKPPPTKPLGPLHRAYLKSRGFNPKEIRQLWNIEATENYGDLSWCVFVPIYFHGEPVSWIVRSIGSKFRYRAAPITREKIAAKSILYGMDYVRHTAIVVEGVTKVWKLGPGSVATLGTSWTQKQMLRLSKIPRRIIMFDSEESAQYRARQLARELETYDGETIIAELESSDQVDTASDEEIAEIRKEFMSDELDMIPNKR